MHEGCSGTFKNGKEVVNKIRQMGFAKRTLPEAFPIKCVECGNVFEMNTLEDSCPNCNMVYGVTPCGASDVNNVKAAGINY